MRMSMSCLQCGLNKWQRSNQCKEIRETQHGAQGLLLKRTAEILGAQLKILGAYSCSFKYLDRLLQKIKSILQKERL